MWAGLVWGCDPCSLNPWLSPNGLILLYRLASGKMAGEIDDGKIDASTICCACEVYGMSMVWLLYCAALG